MYEDINILHWGRERSAVRSCVGVTQWGLPNFFALPTPAHAPRTRQTLFQAESRPSDLNMAHFSRISVFLLRYSSVERPFDHKPKSRCTATPWPSTARRRAPIRLCGREKPLVFTLFPHQSHTATYPGPTGARCDACTSTPKKSSLPFIKEEPLLQRMKK